MRIIMGIQIGDRNSDAVKVQELLTEYGCYIKTRLGLHDSGGSGSCSATGLILLEFVDESEDKVKELESKLATLDNISVRRMEF